MFASQLFSRNTVWLNTLHVIVLAGRIDRVKAPLAIGGCICGGDCFFDGYMDSVRGFYIDLLTSTVYLSMHCLYIVHANKYSGTSPYGHLTSKKTSTLQSQWFSHKLYSIVQITPSNNVTSPLRSLLPTFFWGDLNSEVPLYII